MRRLAITGDIQLPRHDAAGMIGSPWMVAWRISGRATGLAGSRTMSWARGSPTRTTFERRIRSVCHASHARDIAERHLKRPDRTFEVADRYRCPAVSRRLPGVACAPIDRRSPDPDDHRHPGRIVLRELRHAICVRAAPTAWTSPHACRTDGGHPRGRRGHRLQRPGGLARPVPRRIPLLPRVPPLHLSILLGHQRRLLPKLRAWRPVRRTPSRTPTTTRTPRPRPSCRRPSPACCSSAATRRGSGWSRRPRRVPRSGRRHRRLVETPSDDLAPIIEAGLAALGAKALVENERAEAEAEQRRLAEELRLHEEQLALEQAEQVRLAAEAQQAWEAQQAFEAQQAWRPSRRTSAAVVRGAAGATTPSRADSPGKPSRRAWPMRLAWHGKPTRRAWRRGDRLVSPTTHVSRTRHVWRRRHASPQPRPSSPDTPMRRNSRGWPSSPEPGRWRRRHRPRRTSEHPAPPEWTALAASLGPDVEPIARGRSRCRERPSPSSRPTPGIVERSRSKRVARAEAAQTSRG